MIIVHPIAKVTLLIIKATGAAHSTPGVLIQQLVRVGAAQPALYEVLHPVPGIGRQLTLACDWSINTNPGLSLVIPLSQ